ncbi:MAG: DUF5067 domain-containing protein [Ruminococcus sp.]|nr:DUF5067 domain-containing protein [Ruminococcus sp.]
MINNKGGTKLNATLLILVVFLAIILAVAVVRAADKKKNEGSTAQTTTAPPQTIQTEVTSSRKEEIVSTPEKTESEAKPEYEIKVNKAYISQDYQKNTVLVVEYEWTNNSDKATSFTFAFQDNVYQNGIECSSSVFGCDDIDSEKQLTKIQPGTTFTLNVGYKLNESDADAEIIISDLYGRKELLKTIVDL